MDSAAVEQRPVGAALADCVRSRFVRWLAVGVAVTVLAATGSLELTGSGAPPSANAASVAISVFPVEPRCSYVDTWLAPRSGGRQHLGVDIIANAGAKVYAPDDGVVTKLTYDSPAVRSGNAMRFTRADGTYFFMGHFSSFASGIAVGKRYRAGEVIAFVGRTGNTTVNHLHFEVHPGGGAAVNPTPIVRAVDRCSSSPPPPPLPTLPPTVPSPTVPPSVPPTTVPPTTVPPTVPPTTVPPTTVPPTTVAPPTVPPTTVPPTTVPPPSVPSPGAGSYAPARITAVGPVRVVDSRFGRHPAPSTSGTTAYSITGGAVPADATAAQLTVWASGSAAGGYVAVVPCDSVASTGTATVLTSAERTTGASVWTPVIGGQVCVRTNVTTQLMIDVQAYSSPRSTLGVTATNPVRVFDSAWAGKLLRAGTPRTLRVAGAPGMPSSAAAATLTLTTAGSASTGTVQAYPCGGSPSGVPVAVATRVASSVSFTVPVAADGSVCLVSTVDVPVTVDVVAAWVPNGAAVRPLAPLRLFDSRSTGRLVARSASAVQAAGAGRIPADARAVAVNVFVINAAQNTTVLVQPCGAPATTAVMVTAAAGSSSSGSGTVTLGNGRLCVTASASVHVVVDVTASA